jgi:uncharacterized membrane protein YwzB
MTPEAEAKFKKELKKLRQTQLMIMMIQLAIVVLIVTSAMTP